MAKSISAIGFPLASEAVEQHGLHSKMTLLDYDIILFRPDLDSFINGFHDSFQGKPSLNDGASSRLQEACSHWKREIRQAVAAGRTVFVFLPERRDVFVATGEKQHSGTGKSRQTTRVVTQVSNYTMLPVDLTVTNAAGSSVRLTDAGARWLAPYWTEFGASFGYKVQIAAERTNRLEVWLATKGATLAVGGLVEMKSSGGALILLPNLEFEDPEFFEEVDEETVWSDLAAQFAARLISSVIGIDKVWRAASEATPEPLWATLPVYTLPGEQRLQSELTEAERRVKEAQAKVDSLKDKLASAGRLRDLLFEKGKPLEQAIIEALMLMGFEAKPYKGGSSEFDVVFEKDGGRLIGEAEGKDVKAINVDKLRQLAMNIHEDLNREQVSSPAKGVLFGNGFRLQPPEARGVQFTDKCISAALSSSTALVVTSSLFSAAQYLSDHPDEEYKARCRDAMLSGTGLVTLPDPPSGRDTIRAVSDVTTAVAS